MFHDCESSSSCSLQWIPEEFRAGPVLEYLLHVPTSRLVLDHDIQRRIVPTVHGPVISSVNEQPRCSIRISTPSRFVQGAGYGSGRRGCFQNTRRRSNPSDPRRSRSAPTSVGPAGYGTGSCSRQSPHLKKLCALGFRQGGNQRRNEEGSRLLFSAPRQAKSVSAVSLMRGPALFMLLALQDPEWRPLSFPGPDQHQ